MDSRNTYQDDRRAFLRTGAVLAVATTPIPFLLSACTTPGSFGTGDTRMAATIRTGDAWDYDELNGYNRERVAQVGYVAERGDPPALRVEVKGKPLSGLRSGQLEDHAAPWVVKQDAVYDFENRYDPPLPLLPARLEPGATETWQSMVKHDEKDRALRWHVQIEASGIERVNVPAGSFDALPVRRTIRFEHPDFFRALSERTDTLWFVPEVRRWVKREWRGQYLQKMRPDAPTLREDWIVWELTRFTAA